MSGSAGFFTTGNLGDAAVDRLGTDAIPSTAGEVAGAVFEGGIASNPTTRILRNRAARFEAGYVDLEIGTTVTAAADRVPLMPAEEANARFGVQGRLQFTEPVAEAVARDLNEHHRANAVREDIIARREGGILTGGAARFAVGLGSAVLDPLNIASAFVPFAREARIAAMLGSAAEGVAGRALVRGIQGAGAGFVGTVALEPANYWLSRRDQDDYTMGDVITNLAFGTIMGGFLQGGVGAIADRRRGQLPPWSPEMHEGAIRQSVAAVAEGRPVLAAEAMEYTAARQVRQELTDWYQAQQRVSQEADEALSRADSAANARTTAQERLAGLQDEAAKLRAEAAEARGRLDYVDDATTSTRLTEIDAELSGTIPRTRRAALEQERTMLREGADWPTDPSVAQEVQGLETAADRVERTAVLADATARRVSRQVQQAERALSIASEKLTAREAITAALTERTLRRTAAAMGVTVPPQELAEMASRILRAKPADAGRVLDDVLSNLGKRERSTVAQLAQEGRDGGDVQLANGRFARAVQRTVAAEERAAEKLRANLRDEPTAQDLSEDRATAAVAERAPPVEGGPVADELAAIKEDNAKLLQAIERDRVEMARAAGEEAPPASAELDRINEVTRTAESDARMYEAAAACMVRSV